MVCKMPRFKVGDPVERVGALVPPYMRFGRVVQRHSCNFHWSPDLESCGSLSFRSSFANRSYEATMDVDR
jgi:hypothetical protein